MNPLGSYGSSSRQTFPQQASAPPHQSFYPVSVQSPPQKNRVLKAELPYGVEKLKTIGDGYLCVGGLQGDPVEAGGKMLKFAQEILAFVLKRKGEVEASGKKYWNIRIGVHCGPLVAGVVGVKRMAYDIWGDTVNIAARIQQGSEPGRINLSKDFRDLMGGSVG